MKENLELSRKIEAVIKNIQPVPAQVSFAVINLNTPEPEISGVNMDEFIYPASVYKVFIGAEVLRKVFIKSLHLDGLVEIQDPNEVDTNIKLFPKDIGKDLRPLLKAGDKVTVDHLLELMFSRSDNTAANTLMDLADREDINNNIILPNGWKGSDVTRKFMDRLKESSRYQKSSITVTTTRHLAEFFIKLKLIHLLINGFQKS